MTREYTRKLMQMVDDGMLAKDDVILACLNYMSEQDVKDMCQTYEFIDENDDEYDD